MFDKLIDVLITVWNDFWPVIIIKDYEQAVMLRGGKFKKILYPGIHFKVSFLDHVFEDNVKTDTMIIKEVNITTLDGKTVTIGCQFEYTIEDIYKAMIETSGWRTNLHDICQGILSDALEDINWDDIRKKTTKNAISKRIEKKALEMGIATFNFNFTNKAITRAIKIFGEYTPKDNGTERV